MVLRKTILACAFLLLIITPSTSFAWHDYYGSYGGWDYHGSGRDKPYSYYIDLGTPGYAEPVDTPDYVDASAYFNNAPTPTLVPAGASGMPPLLPPPENQVNEFTVNIPNGHGGYTPILIKRSGTGFIGPQEEFYPQFPKVSQLKIMYGK